MKQLMASGGLDLDWPVVLLVGENGTGKSTLVEALAVACGFNPEGGSQAFRFATRASESSLADHLVVSWRAGRRPRTGFFLRAESFYNVATEIERLSADPGSPPLLAAYGGVSLHERSHGESFLDLVTHRFGPDGLYFLDEPEAALSVHGCLALLRRVVELAGAGSQMIIATHSPILLAVPGARILEIGSDGTIIEVSYDAAMPVTVTRAFLADPGRFLHHLLTDG
ncbi:MAG: AAA family ATPase [Micromonosporaceae bacterium]